MKYREFRRKAKAYVGSERGWQMRIATYLGTHKSAIYRWSWGKKIPEPIAQLLTILCDMKAKEEEWPVKKSGRWRTRRSSLSRH